MRDLMEIATARRARRCTIRRTTRSTTRGCWSRATSSTSSATPAPLLLQHPYESFATSVERFLREASEDPKVRAIKMTLYRTSADSNIIDYLSEAARNGKQVAVVVELKARFDEAANIRFANRLEEFGIHVTYGVVGLKTHCKVILVVRQDYNGLRRYAHIGTGNYHAGTARMYTDFGLLTSRRRASART